MRKTRINNRWDIILPDHRADREEWPTWERERMDAINKTVKPGDVVYYVGAEEGDMAGLISMWGGKLVLFEPNNKVWPNIKAIWEANNLEQPYCFQGFCGANNTTDIRIRRQWPACAGGELIGDHGFRELHESGGIPITTIDQQSTVIGPDIISLDVEGSEWEVLKGANITITEHKPIIFLSLHPEFLYRIYGKYQYDLRAWLKSFGYKETLLSYEHEVHLMYEPL